MCIDFTFSTEHAEHFSQRALRPVGDAMPLMSNSEVAAAYNSKQYSKSWVKLLLKGEKRTAAPGNLPPRFHVVSATNVALVARTGVLVCFMSPTPQDMDHREERAIVTLLCTTPRTIVPRSHLGSPPHTRKAWLSAWCEVRSEVTGHLDLGPPRGPSQTQSKSETRLPTLYLRGRLCRWRYTTPSTMFSLTRSGYGAAQISSRRLVGSVKSG